MFLADWLILFHKITKIIDCQVRVEERKNKRNDGVACTEGQRIHYILALTICNDRWLEEYGLSKLLDYIDAFSFLKAFSHRSKARWYFSTILANSKRPPVLFEAEIKRSKREKQEGESFRFCSFLLTRQPWPLVLLPWWWEQNGASFAFPQPPCWRQSYQKHLPSFFGLGGGDHPVGEPPCDRGRDVPIASSSCLHQRRVSCLLRRRAIIINKQQSRRVSTGDWC